MGRPKTMDTRINLSVSDEFILMVDEWRRHQPDIPPRAEAIRRLVEMGKMSIKWGCIKSMLLGMCLRAAEDGRLPDDDIERLNKIIAEHNQLTEKAFTAVYSGSDSQEIKDMLTKYNIDIVDGKAIWRTPLPPVSPKKAADKP